MTETITLDTRKCESTVGNARIAPLRRGERGNVPLVVFVRRGCRPYDLTDMTAHLVWKAADGKLVGPVPMEVTDPATGTVRCTLPDACYSTVGTARAYVELRRGAELVDTTDELGVKVLECIDADAEQAEEYKPLIAEVREAVADAKQATTEAYNAANVANEAAINANEAAINANEAAVNANNAADSVSAYTEIIEQNKKRITSLEGTVSKQGKQIANLQGIVATEETDSTEAYTKTVPTGAQKWASLDKVGGKTVVWNQQRENSTQTEVTENGITFRCSATSLSINGTATSSSFFDWIGVDTIAGRKYLIDAHDGINNTPVAQIYLSSNNEYELASRSPLIFSASYTGADRLKVAVYKDATVNSVITCNIIDLTVMFGSGNEPTSLDDPRIQAIKAYAEEHPEYNPGELMSAEVVEVESKGTFPIPAEVRDLCPGYGWSAGTVCNEIDFERKGYLERVGKIVLDGTNTGLRDGWSSDVTNSNGIIRLVNTIDDMKYIARSVCDRWESYNGFLAGNADTERISTTTYQNYVYVTIRASRLSGDLSSSEGRKIAFNNWLHDNLLTMYYELAEPIEVDLSDVLPDDHFIEVEAGGTVTFKQASTQLTVPSSVTYQISTKEVVANA